MERLTKRNEWGTGVCGVESSCTCDSLCGYMEKMVDKLAEYEDLEEQGKLSKLPCKVGDTVYTNTSIQGWYFRKENRPYEANIVFIGINGVDNFINVYFGNGRMLQFKFSDIGKTVFLSKEEAETALKKVNYTKK